MHVYISNYFPTTFWSASFRLLRQHCVAIVRETVLPYAFLTSRVSDDWKNFGSTYP